MDAPLIANVSDTARWVAAYRARESARKDALFRDPLADRLAGERGHAIAALAPRMSRNGWPLVTRTKLIDDLVQASVAQRCDCVLNLAAGLDTRPYRLKLPPALRWVEADLPAILEEKEQLLSGEVPVCRLQREKVDLADASARSAFLASATKGSTTVLVITEGLLLYLTEEQVRAISRDLLSLGPLHSWVIDLLSPAVLQALSQGMGRLLDQAPMRFAPAEGVRFFESMGWSVRDVQPIVKAAAKFHRLPWFLHLPALLPSADPRQLGKSWWSAVVRLARA
jgi:methyltransferase (TIGR00027 family)